MNLVRLRRPSSSSLGRCLPRPWSPRLHCSDAAAAADHIPQAKRGSLPSLNARSCCASRVQSNSLITRHGRAGNLRGAQAVFDKMPHRDVISWTALLTAYAENGDTASARAVFDGMPKRNTASWNAMITAYTRDLRIREAADLFGRMPEKNVVSYGAMTSGFARAGMLREAEELCAEMPPKWRDPIASNALISGYLRRGELEEAVIVFQRMSVRDVVSWSSLVDGYCKHGQIDEARKLFETMPEKNVVTWTSMIRGYMKGGLWEDGFLTFLAMRRDGVSINTITLSVILDACTDLARIGEGIQIHGLILSMGFGCDTFLGNSLINMYFRVDCLTDAKIVFANMEKKDVVSWNSMITGYVQTDRIEEAHMLFEQMPTRDVVSWTSMLVGFSNRGQLEESVHLFREMPQKDDVAWTAMVSGFVGNEEHETAFRWFVQMLREGILPNPFSLSSILSASAGLTMLNQGMQVHACAVKMYLESAISVQNSLVSMYAKCGNLADACQIFLSIRDLNIVSMNSMITGFAQHGLAEEALELFRKMQTNGYKPNQVTFLGVLSACSHGGLVEEGYMHFQSMSSSYGIEPGPDHYTCMVDLLGRAGLLTEAAELIGSLPFDPHSAVWGALLGACRTHFDLGLAKHAAGQIFELEPDNATAYAVLSEMYSLAGLRKDEEEVRAAKRSKGLRKNRGCSWVTLDNRVCVFFAGDKSHSEWREIFALLSVISREIEEISCYI
uniref:Pentatricopeptide repeat-containing protein At1g53600, mitochondrial n=1 Tax=Anthurium amnicola TaxID=1678845 RepID=A0A1D1Z2A8_9ARAE